MSRLRTICRESILGLGFCLLLSACGGGGGDSTPVTPPPVTLAVSGASVEAVAGGKPVGLTATASAGAGTPSWQLAAGAPGSLSATTGNSVNYLPPASVGVNTQVTVTASVAGVSQSLSLTLYPDPGSAGLSLIAGNVGGAGHIDGSGSAARFLGLGGMTGDNQGRLLVGEAGNGISAIRLVSAAGVVSTLTAGPSGYVDGPLAGARLDYPTSICAAADGTIYFIDANALRKISSAGVVSTVSTAFNSKDSPDTRNTRVLANGADGVYVMEYDRISKVSASGTVTVLAGARDGGTASLDGQGADARFIYLLDMAIDKNGDLFVIDSHLVRKITPAGLVTTIAGSQPQQQIAPQDGNGSAAYFLAPVSIAADASGNLLVVDGTNTSVAGTSVPLMALRKVTQAGAVTTVKTGLARIRQVRIDSAGRIVLAGWSELGVLGADNVVATLAGMDDDSYIDIDGRGAAARLTGLRYVAADPGGSLYVIEQGARGGSYMLENPLLYLRKIAPDGTVTTLVNRELWFGKARETGPAITKPGGIAVDRQGNLYISEVSAQGPLAINSWGGSIVKVTPDGVASVFAGKHDEHALPAARVDGAGEAARFFNATMLGFDADGNLYVDDGAIRKITPAAVVSTVSALPAGFSADADGNTYLADGTTVVRVTPAGTRTVVAGVAGQSGNVLGALPGSLYQIPFDSRNPRAGIARTGPRTYAVLSGSAVLKLVLP